MYIRIKNQVFQGDTSFETNVLRVRITSKDKTYGEVETMFNGETIEFLNGTLTEVTSKYWIRRIVSIAIINANPRTFEVTLDISSVGDSTIEDMQQDISDADNALIELAEMIIDHDARLETVEAYDERIAENTSDIAGIKPVTESNNSRISNLDDALTYVNLAIEQLKDRVSALEDAQGGAV